MIENWVAHVGYGEEGDTDLSRIIITHFLVKIDEPYINDTWLYFIFFVRSDSDSCW